MAETSMVCRFQKPATSVINETAPDHCRKQPQRKRFAPRTRTGCLTCRARRVKCDEARPACQRCISAWRPCQGYRLPPAPLSVADTRLQPTPVVPTAAEHVLGRYFLAEISAFATDEFNTTFWRRDVPQVARAVPAVWHASNALAGAAWARSPRASREPDAAALVDRESARQYSAAVRHILQTTTTTTTTTPALAERQRPEPRDQTTVLLASILLASYAVSVGEKAVFVALFETSRRLVRQWAFWECLDVPSVSALATQILYVYVKTERVAQEFHLEAAAVEPDAGSPRRPPRSGEPSPMLRWCDALAALQRQPLTSALRACLELDMVWNSVHDILDALPFICTTDDITTAYTQRHAFAPLFEAWEARYATYTARVRTRTHRRAVDIDVAALDLRRMLVRVLLRVPIGRCRPVWSETCWDPFTRDFAAALTCLEAALAPAAAAAAATVGTDMLSTPSIYASCNFIVQKCRAPGLRRKAAAVLRSSLVATLGMEQDEVGKRQHLPLIVDRLMLVEESAWDGNGGGGECERDDVCVPARYICNLHRVARVHIDREVAGDPEVTFLTVGDILKGRPGYREAMDISLSSCAMGG
ncbi:hypothetical protein MY11210_003251 [Beauveria gryllotalpidicola]